MWSSSSSSKRKGEQAREEDDSSADRRPEGGKREERARGEDNSSADRLRRRQSLVRSSWSLSSSERKQTNKANRAIRSRDAARSHELTLFNAHISTLRLSTMWLLEPLGGPREPIACDNRGTIQQLAPYSRSVQADHLGGWPPSSAVRSISLS